MQRILNQKKILELLQDFYELVHVRVGLFSPDGNELLAYPQELMPYCNLIRQSESGNQACMDNDAMAYERAKTNDHFSIYTCHAGLAEMIVPIRKQGLLLGYLMIGQFRIQGEPDHDARRKSFASGAQEDAYQELPLLSMTQVKAALHLLQACAAYVWMEDYINLNEGALALRIREYLLDRLQSKIRLSDLMQQFNVGKTKICNTVRQEFNMSVIELQRTLRLEEAKKLLQSSSAPVSWIAQQVGVNDYNYFSRIFRRHTGMSPSEYRSSHGNAAE